MSEIYRANGKLLISGEYAILKGAQALALPLTKGQTLTVHSQTDYYLTWNALIPGKTWFQASYNEELKCLNTNSPKMANKLSDILKQCIQLNNDTLLTLKNKNIVTELEFEPHWGWGSSSTLINCLGQWLKIDPYTLLENTFGGSGYDIACATHNCPISFQSTPSKKVVQPVAFDPPFQDKIAFVYTGKKQDSGKEVKRFLNNNTHNQDIIDHISRLTNTMVTCSEWEEFGYLMEEHEIAIAQLIGSRPIKEKYFKDFQGSIKSLGAWGGDFIMVLSDLPLEKVQHYFAQKGLSTLFTYKEIVLNK